MDVSDLQPSITLLDLAIALTDYANKYCPYRATGK